LPLGGQLNPAACADMETSDESIVTANIPKTAEISDFFMVIFLCPLHHRKFRHINAIK